MPTSPLAGKPAPQSLLINTPRLVSSYYTLHPDLNDATKLVSFGTSGHRGTALDGSFNEDHILAICQSIVELRRSRGLTGPLYLGKDTHALSGPALNTAIGACAARCDSGCH